MDYTQIYKLLKKFRQQTLTKEEEALLLKWYDELDISSENHTSDRTSVLKQEAYEIVHKQLFSRESDLQSSKVKPFYKYLHFKVAATVVLFFTIGYFFYPRSSEKEEKPMVYSYNSIECPEGKRMKVTLPDSSQIWLQGGTTLKYQENFTANRHIHLEKGEAFFEIKPDSTHPFFVKMPELTIQVVGTSFNVTAYKESELIEVVVSSGKVNVTDSVNFSKSLSLNQAMTYDKKNKSHSIKMLASDQLSSSKDGNYYLQSIKLAELLIKLEKIYGYQFVLKDKSIAESVNSLEFSSSKPITEVLNTLKLINNIDYEIVGNQILLSRI